MRNKIKTYLLYLSLTLFFINISYAKDMTSGYFVVPNDNMSERVQKYLGNKLKVSLSRAGVTATDGYFPMVTIVNYDEIETVEVSGIRTMYKTTGEVSIMILFEHTKTVLAATSLEISGVGTSKKNAQKTAIREITFPQSELKKLLKKAEENYSSAINSFGKKRLSEARKLKAQGKNKEAVKAASGVPQDCSSFKDARQLIAQIDKERREKIKAERERKALERKREHELKVLKEKNKHEQEMKKLKQRETQKNTTNTGSASSTNYNNTSNTASSTSSNTGCNEALEEYENFVDEYIDFALRAADGDFSVITQASSLMQKAESANTKIQNMGEAELGSGCWERYLRIHAKLMEASQKISQSAFQNRENAEEKYKQLFEGL